MGFVTLELMAFGTVVSLVVVPFGLLFWKVSETNAGRIFWGFLSLIGLGTILSRVLLQLEGTLLASVVAAVNLVLFASMVGVIIVVRPWHQR